jgi:hypothetical protein
MLPSGRFFLDRDSVYENNRRARQRALWLYDRVREDVDKAEELNVAADSGRYKAKEPPFPKLWGKEPRIDEKRCQHVWGVVADVAATYPRLLAWLAEGRVSRTWNVFGSVVGVARLIPGLRWLLWHFMFEPVAHYAPWRTALYDAILQELRREKNKAPAHILTCSGSEVPGLSAVTDVAVIHDIPGRNELRQRIVNMSSGCIGISGLRGSGKTALIRDFCSHRYGTPHIPWVDKKADQPFLPGMRVMIQAPLPFDAREYLIHQYACLCEAVLADVRFNPTTLVEHALGPILRPGLGRPRALLGGLTGVALLVLAGGLFAGTWPHLAPRTWELIGAVVALTAGLAAIGWRTRWAFIEARQVITLAADAQARLRRLQFLRSYTRTHGGTLSAPMGAGLSMGTISEFAELAITLPELIDDYRDFVERVVGGLEQKEREARKARAARDSEAGKLPSPETSVRLVIGLDEIDQIDDVAEACRFLDELSAVFGTPKCVYLIAVSPGTLAAADQRTVPLRTSSGGLFDEMVWLDPLTEDEAATLLARRVIGLPPTFAKLCYVLSGGLPRELLRIARALFTTDGARSGTATLADTTRHVIAGEMRALKHRALACAASLTVSAAPRLFRLLNDDQWPMNRLNAAADHHRQAVIDSILGDVSLLWDGDGRAGFREPGKDVDPFTSEVCDSLLASLYFLLTVYQLFTGTSTGDYRLEDVPLVLRDLSRACIALGTNPYLSALLVGAARKQLANAKFPGFTDACAPSFLSQAIDAQLKLVDSWTPASP